LKVLLSQHEKAATAAAAAAFGGRLDNLFITVFIGGGSRQPIQQQPENILVGSSK